VSVVIVVLAIEVRRFKASHEALVALKQARFFPEVGQWIYPVRAGALLGDSVTVGEVEPGRSQVLIVFTTSCPVCKASLVEWKRLTEQLHGDSAKRFDVHWVSLSPRDSTEAYLRDHGIAASVVFPPNDRMMLSYRVFGVPMTIVVNSEGRVSYVRPKLFATPLATDSTLVAAELATVPRKKRRGSADSAAATDSTAKASPVSPNPPTRSKK
jgi:hypothetical protein